MASTLKPPSLEYILGLAAEARVDYQAQDDQIDRARRTREQTNVIPLPDPWKGVQIEVHDPALTDDIQRTTATLSINPPTLTVTPAKLTDAGQANATLREHWTEAVLREAGTRIPMLDTYFSVTDGLVGDGGGWSKLLFSRDLWDARYALRPGMFTDDPMETDDEGNARSGRTAAAKHVDAVAEAKRACGSPFVDAPVDARSVYPIWQGTNLGEVLEDEIRPLHSTFRQYRLGQDNRGNIVPEELGQGTNAVLGQASGGVRFLTHWDSVWASYLVVGRNLAGETTAGFARQRNGDPLQWRHGYERVPYFGAMGVQFGYMRNRKVGWGVCEAKRWMTEFYSFLLTIAAQAVARDTMTSFTRTAVDPGMALLGNDGQPREKESFELGVIYDLLPGQQMAPFALPAVAESMKFLLPLVRDAITRLDSPTFSGQLSGLDASGFAINQAISLGKVRYAPLCHNLERYLKEKTEFLWFLTRKKVREEVHVFAGGKDGWLSAAPETFQATVEIQWTVDPEQPSDVLIRQRALIEGMQALLVSHDQAIEELGRNPDEVRLGIAMDEIRASPEYKQLMHGLALQAIGQGGLLEAQQAQQVAQTGVVTPAMGQPGMPDQGAAASPALAPMGAPRGTPSGVVVPAAGAAATAGVAA